MMSLKLRHELYKSVRKYFDQLDYLEVETPILVNCPGAESFLNYFSSSWQDFSQQDHKLYLRSSPELHMKRLLARGNPRIYQIAKSFRNAGELGPWHHPEFTMLEWYELGLDLKGLRQQTLDLMSWNSESLWRQGYSCRFKPDDFITPRSFTMAEAFSAFSGLELGPLQGKFLQEARQKKSYVKESDDGITAYGRILIEEVEPALKNLGVVVVEDFPPELTALCKVEGDWAKRFEIYIDGIELCNAFEELTNAKANEDLFSRINAERKLNGFEIIPEDREFLLDIQQGLPPCSGIALGLDRWLAILSGHQHIQSLNPFAGDKPFFIN